MPQSLRLCSQTPTTTLFSSCTHSLVVSSRLRTLNIFHGLLTPTFVVPTQIIPLNSRAFVWQLAQTLHLGVTRVSPMEHPKLELLISPPLPSSPAIPAHRIFTSANDCLSPKHWSHLSLLSQTSHLISHQSPANVIF